MLQAKKKNKTKHTRLTVFNKCANWSASYEWKPIQSTQWCTMHDYVWIRFQLWLLLILLSLWVWISETKLIENIISQYKIMIGQWTCHPENSFKMEIKKRIFSVRILFFCKKSWSNLFIQLRVFIILHQNRFFSIVYPNYVQQRKILWHGCVQYLHGKRS